MPHELVDLWNSVPHNDKKNEAFQIVYTQEEVDKMFKKMDKIYLGTPQLQKDQDRYFKLKKKFKGKKK